MRSFALSAALLALPFAVLADPLPSWNDTAAKSAITGFVERVTDPASPDYLPEAARIAVFDNDGTLWSEQPAYFQLFFALDTLRAKAATDPSILTSDALKAAAAGDLAGALAGGEKGLLEIVDASHSGMTVEAFETAAKAWLGSATHPKTGRSYPEMTFQPMLELLSYLREEQFTTWIVTGGGADFVRALAPDAYGIPSWQVVGSEGGYAYEDSAGAPAIMKTGGLSFVDDKTGKPIGIMRQIGQRPVFAAGNSDGDFAMLDWTTSGPGPRFGMLIHHTDAAREFAYDREGHIGVLARGLDEGPGKGWTIVDMAADWKTVWPE